MGHVLTALRSQYGEKETGTGAAWGTRPTTPVLVHFPTMDYGIKLVREVQEHRTFAGRAQSHHIQNPYSVVQGSLKMPLYGAFLSAPAVSIMQYFLDLATDSQETLDPRPSIRIFDIHRDGAGATVAGHEDTGLRVNKMTLEGSEAGIVLTLDMIGKTQIALAASAVAPPDDRNGLLECLFSDSTLSIGGTPVSVSKWKWELDWGLEALKQNSNRPTKVSAQHNLQTLSWTPLKEAGTYDAYLRLQDQTELEAILVVKGNHSQTSGTAPADNYTVGTFTFPRASLKTADDQLSIDTFGTQDIMMKCLKPDTSANTVTPVWSVAA